nr:hypothetical protein [Tanacetum cinerariifolium]
MSSDSHTTITYTSMSSYEVIVNGYFGMPTDPLDPYPLPAALSPTAELLGYIMDSEPEMEPKKEDGDNEKSEGDSIDDEEEEEHLAPTVPALALHNSIPASEDSDETEPFEESETAATPPPFGYHVAARIYV